MATEQLSNQLYIASFYLESNRPERALEALEQSDSEAFNNPIFWHLRGRALFDLGRPLEAKAAVGKGLALEPEAVHLLHLLCNCETALGAPAKAEQAILAALRVAPEDPQLLCRYALLLSQESQLAKAERLVEEAARIAPEHPAVVRTRIALAYLRGNDREAARQSQEALTKNPEDVYGHYMLGAALTAQGKHSKAGRSLNTAARLDPVEEAIVSAARDNRFRQHWLLWPLRPIYRFGPARIWIAAIVIMVLLSELGNDLLFTAFALLYILYAAYSWIAPPLLRRWLSRKQRTFKLR